MVDPDRTSRRIKARKMFILQTKTANGWRKLPGAGPFLCRESAEAYARKYLPKTLANYWRVIEV